MADCKRNFGTSGISTNSIGVNNKSRQHIPRYTTGIIMSNNERNTLEMNLILL